MTVKENTGECGEQDFSFFEDAILKIDSFFLRVLFNSSTCRRRGRENAVDCRPDASDTRTDTDGTVAAARRISANKSASCIDRYWFPTMFVQRLVGQRRRPWDSNRMPATSAISVSAAAAPKSRSVGPDGGCLTVAASRYFSDPSALERVPDDRSSSANSGSRFRACAVVPFAFARR